MPSSQKINKGDVNARIRVARTEMTRQQTIDSAAESERDPSSWLN
jgi:hypothetical protein